MDSYVGFRFKTYILNNIKFRNVYKFKNPYLSMGLNLSNDICEKNLDYLGSLCLDDLEEWGPIKDCEVMPLDLVDLAFPRFKNKKSNLEYLVNPNAGMNFELENENLEKSLLLLDGFNVATKDDLDYFDGLKAVYAKICCYEVELGLHNYFADDKDLIMFEMEKIAYLAGDISSDNFCIDLDNCYTQLEVQREILVDCLKTTQINQQAGWEMFLENSKLAQEYSDPDYLPILKEKAKRVGNFIVSSGYEGKLD